MIAATSVAVALGAFLLSVLLATGSGVLGNEAHAWAPYFARKLIQRAARWRPANERQDFEDENLDLIEGYVADGRKLAALTMALFEFRRGVWSLGLPTWLLADDNPIRLMTFGLVSGLSIGLVGGLVFGLGVGIVGGLVFGIGVGLVSGLFVRLVGFPGVGVWVGLACGVIFGIVGGLVFGVSVGVVGGLGYGLVVLVTTSQGRWLVPTVRILRTRIQGRLERHT